MSFAWSQRLTVVYLPATQAQAKFVRETCASCLAHVSVNLVQVFLVQVSCSQLSTALSIPGQKLSGTLIGWEDHL